MANEPLFTYAAAMEAELAAAARESDLMDIDFDASRLHTQQVRNLVRLFPFVPLLGYE